MQKKYELIETPTEWNRDGYSRKLYQIKALIDIDCGVVAGDVGGLIESEHNLSHEGNCWVHPNAVVTEGAQVFENAQVMSGGIVTENAKVFGEAVIQENATVWGDAEIYGDAVVEGNGVCVSGDAKISGSAVISGVDLTIAHGAIIEKPDDYLVVHVPYSPCDIDGVDRTYVCTFYKIGDGKVAMQFMQSHYDLIQYDDGHPTYDDIIQRIREMIDNFSTDNLIDPGK